MRVTKMHDVTSPAGIRRCMNAVRFPHTLLWASIPCTGGSPWQHYNKQFPNAQRMIKEHKALFRKIWRTFEATAEECIACGGTVAIEWPRQCTYWTNLSVQRFMSRHGLERVHFDGCMFNLISIRTGKPIKKPWSVATNNQHIRNALAGRMCDGSHEHTPCAGKDTQRTEGYTEDMVKCIHKAFKAQAKQKHKQK